MAPNRGWQVQKPTVLKAGFSYSLTRRLAELDAGDKALATLPAPSALRFATGMRSTLLLRDGGSEVRILVRHPIHEFSHVRVVQQTRYIHPVALQFGIGEVRRQRLLAN